MLVDLWKALRLNRRHGRVPVEVDRRRPGAPLPWTCKEATVLMNNAIREFNEVVSKLAK